MAASSVIPVLICVLMTSGKSTVEEHIAINNLMNNSQVFLAFALPFTMLPLLIFTNSRTVMGGSFKNPWLVKLLGWFSVVGLIYLNVKGLPDQIEGFFGENPSASQIFIADHVAYVIIGGVLLLLAWTIMELFKGDKRFLMQLKLGKEE